MYVPAGVKRKFSEVEEECGGTAMMADRSAAYNLQRQTILDMSMFKLRVSPGVRRTEPSLRRSVLIYNTLRVIEHELQQEGGVPPSHLGHNLFPPLPNDGMDPMNLDPIPGVGDHQPPTSPPRPECPPTPLPQCPLTTSSSLTAGLIGDIPRTPFCSLHEQVPPPPTPAPPMEVEESPEESEPIIHTLQPVTNATKFSDLLNTADRTPLTSISSIFDLDYLGRGTGPLPLIPMPALPNPCSMQSHRANNGQTDIFGDIDLTLYDFDLFSSFSSNVKMAPLSAEELMHSFPADSHKNHPTQLSSPSPCFRNELLNDDLDHIMQVLVGI